MSSGFILILLASSFASSHVVANSSYDCVSADTSHSKSFSVDVFLEGDVEKSVTDARVLIHPNSDFKNGKTIELLNIQQMKMISNPVNSNAPSIVRLASGMGGEGARSPWRFSLMNSSQSVHRSDENGNYVAFLRSGTGAQKSEFKMQCKVRDKVPS